MTENLGAFRLGDIRGIYPDEINEAFALSFAHAFVHHFNLKGRIATGRDMRNSSMALQSTINQGLKESGITVLDLGLCATELGYFASTRSHIEAVIIITASHNPDRYNGFKCVLRHGVAVTFDSGLKEVKALMKHNHRNKVKNGSIISADLLSEYIEFMKTKFTSESLRSGNIALNGLNGTAMTLAENLSEEFSLSTSWFRGNPGPIPKDGADPTGPRMIAEMQEYMRLEDFSLGVAWDGDCDRCVFFTRDGKLVPAYYVIGIMIEHFLSQHHGSSVVLDTKLCWNTLDIINQYEGKSVKSKTGHAFMKYHMRKSKAVYGGELAAHHYFQDFFGCDSGMFAWLKMVNIIGTSGIQFEDLIQKHRENVCCTSEISLSIPNINPAFSKILSLYESSAVNINYFDGLSLEMSNNWRFSLRQSKTEPLIRVNFESRGRPEQLLSHSAEVLTVLQTFAEDEYDWAHDLAIQ